MLPVLICVDDELILLKSLEFEILDFFHNQIEVLTAQSPDDAYFLINDVIANNHKVFLVISDQHLGIYDGVEFLKSLNEIYPEIYKILLTGYKTDEIEKKLKKEANLYAVIEKPWSSSEIYKKIEECLKLFLES